MTVTGTILVVEDEAKVARAMGEWLKKYGAAIR